MHKQDPKHLRRLASELRALDLSSILLRAGDLLLVVARLEEAADIAEGRFPESRLTPARKRVLDKIRTPGTARTSLHLQGAEFKAAMWLYENKLVGMIGRGFYPL